MHRSVGVFLCLSAMATAAAAQNVLNQPAITPGWSRGVSDSGCTGLTTAALALLRRVP